MVFKQNKNKQIKVYVGVSGGVDSSVALALLQSQGYDVVGVFIRTWQPDWIECTWRDERRDAMRVCAHLRVPFVELDLEQEYKQGVADYMIAEYRVGRTPNPDVMCNKEVKFGGFLKWALAQGADYVATGHYVDRRVLSNGNVEMLRGVDTNKDQSYFLWTLTQAELKHILFPVGSMSKPHVRKLAEKYKLPTATKKDSQGICFIGEIDMKEFLSHYIDEQPGTVVNEQGTAIGTHQGVLFYTLGERHGFTIHAQYKGTDDAPYYVVGKNIHENTLVVSHNKDAIEQPTHIFLQNVVDNQSQFTAGDTYQVQIRYRGEYFNVTVTEYNKEKQTMNLEFENKAPQIVPGQSMVLYRGEVCYGGGIVA